MAAIILLYCNVSRGVNGTKRMHKKSCTFIFQVSWETMIAHSKDGLETAIVSVTLGKPLHVHSCLKGDRAHEVDIIVLLQSWSCKWYTEKPLHIHSGFPGDEVH